MIRYYVHEKMPLDAAKSYQIIYDTINKANDDLKKELDPTGQEAKRTFANFVFYLIISPHDTEKVNMLVDVTKQYARELEGAGGSLQEYVEKLLSTELLQMDQK